MQPRTHIFLLIALTVARKKEKQLTLLAGWWEQNKGWVTHYLNSLAYALIQSERYPFYPKPTDDPLYDEIFAKRPGEVKNVAPPFSH